MFLVRIIARGSDTQSTLKEINMQEGTNQTGVSGSNANQMPTEMGNMGLLALIDKVKVSLETNHSKKIEELEYKILEKEEIIESMQSQLSLVKNQNEEKDIELRKLHEEINAGKKILEQLLQKLNGH